MNRFFTLLLAASCLTAVGQQDLWEYPFPYNPDGNQDGFIGLNDMLDLLALYGNEFPGSFYGDSTGAVLNLGIMPLHKCVQEANAAGRQWRVMSNADLWRNFIRVAEFGQQYYEDSGLSNFNFWSQDRVGRLGQDGLNYHPYADLMINQPGGEGAPPNVQWDCEIQNSKESVNLSASYCVIATEVRPEIEYEIIIRNGISDLKSTVRDSIQNGWNLQGGAVTNWSGNTSQTIWRFKDTE